MFTGSRHRVLVPTSCTDCGGRTDRSLRSKQLRIKGLTTLFRGPQNAVKSPDCMLWKTRRIVLSMGVNENIQIRVYNSRLKPDAGVA
jgi:hypothetical protein